MKKTTMDRQLRLDLVENPEHDWSLIPQKSWWLPGNLYLFIDSYLYFYVLLVFYDCLVGCIIFLFVLQAWFDPINLPSGGSTVYGISVTFLTSGVLFRLLTQISRFLLDVYRTEKKLTLSPEFQDQSFIKILLYILSKLSCL